MQAGIAQQAKQRRHGTVTVAVFYIKLVHQQQVPQGTLQGTPLHQYMSTLVWKCSHWMPAGAGRQHLQWMQVPPLRCPSACLPIVAGPHQQRLPIGQGVVEQVSARAHGASALLGSLIDGHHQLQVSLLCREQATAECGGWVDLTKIYALAT